MSTICQGGVLRFTAAAGPGLGRRCGFGATRNQPTRVAVSASVARSHATSSWLPVVADHGGRVWVKYDAASFAGCLQVQGGRVTEDYGSSDSTSRGPATRTRWPTCRLCRRRRPGRSSARLWCGKLNRIRRLNVFTPRNPRADVLLELANP
jgi:hypothetical protein